MMFRIFHQTDRMEMCSSCSSFRSIDRITVSFVVFGISPFQMSLCCFFMRHVVSNRYDLHGHGFRSLLLRRSFSLLSGSLVSPLIRIFLLFVVVK